MLHKTILILFLSVFLLSACDYAANSLQSDRTGNMVDQDYKDALAPREAVPEPETRRNALASVPKLQPYVAGNPSSSSAMPLVTISLNQTVPLRSALYDLAQQADYDVVLDPRISGAIIYSARNKPLDEVIKSISKVAGLRYAFDNNTLRIELDTPFNKTYKVDYLNLVRTNNSSISTDVSVVSGEGADTGSSFESSFTNEIDFWGELETALEQVLSSASSDILKTRNNPSLRVSPVNADVVAVGANGNAPDVNININSDTGDVEEYSEPPLSFSINKQGGIVQVFAPQRVHNEVAKYLELLKKSVTSQVLIEAKVLEVTLNDNFATGINWENINLPGNEFNIGTTNSSLLGNAGGSNIAISFLGNDFDTVINAAAEFGTIRALASPRLTVLNNQTGVLNVATNEVFFDLDVSIQEGSENDPGGRVDVDGDIQTIPIGVLINVQPSIDLVNNTVDMALRPTITNIAGFEDNPITRIASGGTVTTQVPRVNVQEIDTMVSMRSGQTIVMGGLLQDRVATNNNGVPILKDVPYAGSLFKSQSDEVTKTELIIFLKATILNQPGDSIHNTDKDLYRRFADDRRPFAL